MQRHEAIELFKEICDCEPDALITSVFLMPINKELSPEDSFELWLNLSMDTRSRENVQLVAKNHNFATKEKKGYTVIYKPETTEMDIITSQ